MEPEYGVTFIMATPDVVTFEHYSNGQWTIVPIPFPHNGPSYPWRKDLEARMGEVMYAYETGGLEAVEFMR